MTKKVYQHESEVFKNVTRVGAPYFELCRFCKMPLDFGNELQAICVALLDMQTSATDEQKRDHMDAVALAKSVIRLRINRNRHSDE